MVGHSPSYGDWLVSTLSTGLEFLQGSGGTREDSMPVKITNPQAPQETGHDPIVELPSRTSGGPLTPFPGIARPSAPEKSQGMDPDALGMAIQPGSGAV